MTGAHNLAFCLTVRELLEAGITEQLFPLEVEKKRAHEVE